MSLGWVAVVSIHDIHRAATARSLEFALIPDSEDTCHYCAVPLTGCGGKRLDCQGCSLHHDWRAVNRGTSERLRAIDSVMDRRAGRIASQLDRGIAAKYSGPGRECGLCRYIT